MERRLAAIMATDVVGYSRLIRADEEGTIAALKALRADLIDPKIGEYHTALRRPRIRNSGAGRANVAREGVAVLYGLVRDSTRPALCGGLTRSGWRCPGGVERD